MNLNLKAAVTVATFAALLVSFGSPHSSASAADWHSMAGQSWKGDGSAPALMPTANPIPALGAPQTVSAPEIPLVSTNPFDYTVGPAPTIAGSASPFVHSEPRPALPFPLLLNHAVQGYVSDFLERPAGLRLAFERSRPFMPEMIKLMKQQGIPDDLVYLTFAESDFSKRGKGPWQFTVDTATRFGLRVNKWLDERRDPILSTKAAAEYLAELHDQADNDWRVALVAWNTGAGNLERYWSLQGANYTKFADRLPRRTRQLLNRFMAVTFIAHNSPAYGIGDVKYSTEPAWTIHTFKGGTLLKSIAHDFETTVAKLRELNPALRIDKVPPNERAYAIRIPTEENASN